MLKIENWICKIALYVSFVLCFYPSYGFKAPIALEVFRFKALHRSKLFLHPSIYCQKGCTRTSMSTAYDQKQDTTQYNWEDQWYPISPIRDLDMQVPNQVKLLGRDLVVWYHLPSASWQIFRDLCPHRLAPLSEGRLDKSGNLQARYFSTATPLSPTHLLLALGLLHSSHALHAYR